MNTRTIYILGLGIFLIGGTYLIFMMTPVTTPMATTTQPVPAPVPVVPVPSPAPATSTMPMPAPVTVTTPTTSGKAVIASRSTNITIRDYSFLPATLTIKKGTTVTWTNDDIAKHTVTGDQGGPSSSFFGKGQSYSYTFDTPGTYPYHCEPHPYMTAAIIVTE